MYVCCKEDENLFQRNFLVTTTSGAAKKNVIDFNFNIKKVTQLL